MLARRLQRAQLELQSHRHWLQVFVSRKHSYNLPRLSPSSPPLHRTYLGPLTRQWRIQGQSRALSYARRHVKNKEHGLEKGETPDRAAEALRQAIVALRSQDMAQSYYALGDKSKLENRDFRALAQALHQCWRIERHTAAIEKRRAATEALVALAETLVKDVKKGNLRPNKTAHVHLLGLFKECGVREAGISFWRWLERQDEMYVNAAVYGTAIELLAVNGAPLSEMEELYHKALSRFPGAFAAYHFSPDAILQDRDKATTLKGVPMSLLQGILTARLLHGDIRNAYLALDTALRLYPDQTPPRFFTLFLEERPVLETYTVFAMACRAGIIIPSNHFRHFLNALRTSPDLASIESHTLSLRAMLSATYMYASVGGKLTSNLVNELVIVMTQFLRLKGVASLEPKKKQKLVVEVTDAIRATLNVLARYGATPGLSAFNSIITNLGGYGHSKQSIGIALSDAHALGIGPTEITRRSILTAAGLLNDTDFVRKAWEQIVEARAHAGKYPDATDFHCFVKAAHLSNQVDFASEQFNSLKGRLPEHDHWGIWNGLQDSGTYDLLTDSAEIFDLSTLQAEIKKIRTDLQVIDDRTNNRPKVQDFGNQHLPMTLLPIPSRTSLPDPELSRIYDELTTEQLPSQQREAASGELSTTHARRNAAQLVETSIEPQTEHSVTTTNIPFGTLRYENWKCINWLLDEAEASDEVYHKAVDQAIAAGVAPPKRSLGLSLASMNKLESYGLGDTIAAERDGKRKKTVSEEGIQTVREHILRLRGRTV